MRLSHLSSGISSKFTGPSQSNRFWKGFCATSILTIGSIGLTGCNALTNGFIDPTELGKFPAKPLVVNVIKSLDTGIEEPNPEFINATEILPEDLVPSAGDATIGKNDLLSIAITDLVTPGVETTKSVRVSESGNITMPLIGSVPAAGLTEAQLEAKIHDTYVDKQLITNPQVSVSTLDTRARTFSILGSVQQAGQYQILQSDFRLLDALTLARDVTNPYIDYVYVVRHIDQNAATTTMPTTMPNTDVLTPHTMNSNASLDAVAMQSAVANRVMTLRTESQEMPATMPAAPTDQPATMPANTEGHMVTIEGQSVPAGTTMPMPATSDTMTPPDQTAMTTKPFEFQIPAEAGNLRVIRVPLQELRVNGNILRYNIVIRPQDLIYVPTAENTGQYYMGGHVARTGVYAFTGPKVTLTAAVAAAGMFDQSAVPWRTQIIRHLKGKDQQVFANVNLAKIFAGEQPDIYLKSDDLVVVGTTWWAPFVAAIRNGFRITYGFGFLYDRNFDTTNNGNGG